LADDIELCAIQFPGRHERAHEACISSVDALVAELVPALIPYLDRPFAVFGHCMGAIVMFETLRVLARQHGLHATQVFAAGAPPPHRYLAPRVTSGSQSEFKDVLSFIGFARPELLDDPEAERTLLAPVRNDFDAAESYRYVEAEQLSAPILTFAGREDPFAPPSIVREWGRHTSGACSEVSLPGEHYFIVPERVPMLRIMNVELLLRLASISGVEAQVRSLHELPRRATTRARMRLFCFPGIGGDLAHFQALAAAVRSDIEVCGIELPGRGTMSSELPLGRVDELVARIVPALRGFLDLPYAFVGLNIGSAIMTEVARSLRGRGLPLPRQLFVGAAMAPQDCYLAPLHHLPGARLFETLQSFGLTLSQGQGVERILRADCAAAASYGYVEDAPLELPIAVFVGDRDRFIPRGSLSGWARHSTFPLTVTECQAGHDVLHGEALHVVLDAIHSSCPVEQPRNVGREYRAMLSESAE
jgi:surfactin synthase thioesterase subunit